MKFLSKVIIKIYRICLGTRVQENDNGKDTQINIQTQNKTHVHSNAYSFNLCEFNIEKYPIWLKNYTRRFSAISSDEKR